MSQDLLEITERLLRLENAYRRLKITAFSAVVLFGTIVLAAQAPPNRTISAQEFVLTDAEGHARGSWSIQYGATVLQMYDQKNRVRLSLNSYDDGVTVNLLHPESSVPMVQLSAGNHDSALRLSDSSGFSAILGNENLDLGKSGGQKHTSAASLVLCDKAGKVLWSTP